MTTHAAHDVPALTANQMREVDRAMVEDLHVDLIHLMVNAGRSLAQPALNRFAPATVTVLAGPGGNGGGGWSPPGRGHRAASVNAQGWPVHLDSRMRCQVLSQGDLDDRIDSGGRNPDGVPGTGGDPVGIALRRWQR